MALFVIAWSYVGFFSPDINECASNASLCENCANTFGSYECYCDPGFRLTEDSNACEGIIISSYSEHQ